MGHGVTLQLMMPIIAIVCEYLSRDSQMESANSIGTARAIAIMRLSGVCLQLEATRFALCKSWQGLETNADWLSLQHN